MESGDIGDGETRVQEWERRLVQRSDLVFDGDRGNGLMAKREGILQILNNFGFGLQLGGTVGFRLDVLWVEGLSHKRTEKQVIGEADVLHLFGKGTHALELPVGGRE